MNELKTRGLFWASSTSTNRPSGAGGGVIVFSGSANSIIQILVQNANPVAIWGRNFAAGDWNSWVKIC